MARLLDTPITQTDISDYISAYSDFSFELHVLRLLRSNMIRCEHGGHYTDPVTKKSREFDIRARTSIESVTARFAVECKNIRANFPIVVSRLPRSKEDSFNEVCQLEDAKPDTGQFGLPSKPIGLHGRAQRIKNRTNTIYPIGEPVGKSLAQVGRATDNSMVSGDSEVYEKWGQALASLTHLVEEMSSDGQGDSRPHFSFCIPALVVPNDRLWAVDYDYDGNLVGNAQSVDHCSFFIGKDYSVGFNEPSYVVSHLELFTVTGFGNFIKDRLLSLEGLRSLIGRP
jgi:hypothetical protein